MRGCDNNLKSNSTVSVVGTLLVLDIDQDSMCCIVRTQSMGFFVSKTVFIKISNTLIGRANKHISLPENVYKALAQEAPALKTVL